MNQTNQSIGDKVTLTSLIPEGRTRSLRIPVLKLLFSFPVTLSGLLVVLAGLTVSSRFDDPDMWWHLKLGEVIWTTHSIPATDLFSYTTNHHAWIPHEWLSQALIYGAYRFGGYRGLMLWLYFVTATLLVIGYFLCSLYSGNAKSSFLGALTVWLFATSGVAIRPQMIGYTLLLVELLLLHLVGTRNYRWFFWLPPLFAVWVNCHGSFFLGLLLGGLLLFASLFNFQIGSLVSPYWDPRYRHMLALALALSVAALFLNPIGIKQILYPINAILHLPINLSSVDEWMPLQFGDVRAIGYLGILVSIFLLVIVRRSKLLLHELLMLVVGAWMAASHQRMLFVFGIFAAPILSRQLSNLWNAYDVEADRPWINGVFITISLLTVFWSFPNLQNLTHQVEKQSPVKAVEFIKTSHLSGRMLNEYVYGGYLIWAAPEHPVFVDGRGDVFEWTGVLADFGSWATLQSDPNVLLNKYRVDFCLLSLQSPLVRVMPLLDGWKIIYSDSKSVIFIRTPLKNPLK